MGNSKIYFYGVTGLDGIKEYRRNYYLKRKYGIVKKKDKRVNKIKIPVQYLRMDKVMDFRLKYFNYNTSSMYEKVLNSLNKHLEEALNSNKNCKIQNVKIDINKINTNMAYRLKYYNYNTKYVHKKTYDELTKYLNSICLIKKDMSYDKIVNSFKIHIY